MSESKRSRKRARDSPSSSPRRSRSRDRSSPERRKSSHKDRKRQRSRSSSPQERHASSRGSGKRDKEKSSKDAKADEKKADSGMQPSIAAAQSLTGRLGGVYIPPFKLAQMRKEMGELDKSSREFQRLAWDALRKTINGLINKINANNIKDIIPELFQANLVRGRGLFARAVMKAQLASPGFTPIFAALVAVVNTKLPENGELLLKRIIVAFRRAFKRRDKVSVGRAFIECLTLLLLAMPRAHKHVFFHFIHAADSGNSAGQVHSALGQSAGGS
jgi:pre-mRNA-splicing factor CWC22